MDFESICLVSLNAYHRIYPDSFFRRSLRKEDLGHARHSLVLLGFSKLAGLAKENKDYFIILKIIESNVDGVYEMIRTGRTESIGIQIERLRWEIESELLERFERYFREEEMRV